MDDLIIDSSSPLEDEEMIISDEDVRLIDQWLRRIIMEDDNTDLSRGMDSATWTTAPTQENCFIDNILDWLKAKKAVGTGIR